MARHLNGLNLLEAYKLLKRYGYNVTAFLDGWFRAETDTEAVEVEYDSAQYVFRAVDC